MCVRGCRHHLRFEPASERTQPSFSPLRVEGIDPATRPIEDAWEYSVVLSIRNERGEEVTRQVVGVGALQATEERRFTLSVDVYRCAGRRA